MEKTTNNIQFSPLIVGTMRLGDWGANMSTSELEKFIDACLDLGLKDFDHADIYGFYTAETQFGDVLKRRPDLRSKLQITTKCGIKLVCDNRPNHKVKSYDSTKEHIVTSVENSLKELKVDHIDLLLIHRPDYLMNAAEIAASFQVLKKTGKVNYFGVSNFSASQFDLLNSFIPLVTNQVEISLQQLAAFDDGTLDQCQKYGITPTAWSPLGGGAIFSESDDPKIKNLKKVLELVGEKYNASIDQILLAWLMKHPAQIIPVLGTSKIERIKTALAATNINLTHEEWYELWQASTGQEIA